MDALKYTERVGKPCKYIFYQLPVPSKCFLDCDYIAMRTALAVFFHKKSNFVKKGYDMARSRAAYASKINNTPPPRINVAPNLKNAAFSR